MTHRRTLLPGALASLLITIGCAGVEMPADGGPSLDAVSPEDACTAGTADCACLTGARCGPGLRCESERCALCPAGEEGCACGEGGECEGGLECSPPGTCVDPDCPAGAIGCACRAAEPACDASAVCGGRGICEACGSDAAGCPCTGGMCGDGLVCEPMTDRCREPHTCDDLRAAGRCPPSQVCDESTDGGDASCVAESCVAEHRWSTALGACVPCTSDGCSAEPSCEMGAPGSIGVDCESEQRECVVDEDGIGACGGCLAGFADIGGECQAQINCGGRVCGAGEYCDVLSTDGPECVPRPCASPSMVADAVSGACFGCTRDCALDGSTGRYWPFADREGNCVCETLPGYFFDPGGEIRPVLCDADRDGWVHNRVRELNVWGAGADPALEANMRCAIRTVVSVELRDEYGLSSVISSCDEGLLQDRDPATDCTPFPLRLLESARNDIPGEAEARGEAPPYPAGGRRLRANELNALTKVCAVDLGDYDHDGEEDIRQVQATPEDTSALGDAQRLQTFAHFIELYRMIYAPPAAGAEHGRLVIEERSRCDGAFPIRYGADAAFEATDPSSYWRSCERRRDPRFNADVPVPGYDFGQWSCSERNGTCPTSDTDIPAHPTHTAAPAPGAAPIRGHGLCHLGGAAPADGRWRGMHHHSQFQCVEVVGDGAAAPSSPDRERRAFAPSGDLILNTCRVTDCAGMACTDSRFLAGGAYDPVITCATADVPTVSDGTVGWAAVGYRPYGHVDHTGTPTGDQTYNGGCVSEDAEWDFLCSTPDFGRCEDAPANAFGRYRCFGWGDACPMPPDAINLCPSSVCSYTCNPGYDDCNGAAGDGCEVELATDVDHCSRCGNACSLAHATPLCSGGTCRVSTCDARFFDVNGADSDGCECADDAYAASCAAATSVGSVDPGSGVSRTGKIGSSAGSDWFVVRFTPASGAGGGAPRIRFTVNEGDAFRFDVTGVCSGTETLGSCGDGGGLTRLTEYDFTDNASIPGANQYTSRTAAWPTTVLVRVYRINGGLSCANYTIEFAR